MGNVIPQATVRYILPKDVLIVPIAKLPKATLSTLGVCPGGVLVSRPGTRAPAKLLDASGAELIESFVEPRTIAESIIHIAKHQHNSRALLSEALPLIRTLLRDRLLARADTPEAEALLPSLVPGEQLLGFAIASVIKLAHDVEVYRAVGKNDHWVAIKYARGSGIEAARMKHEADVLVSLAGGPVPQLLAQGTRDGRPFLVLEWIEGRQCDEATGDRNVLACAIASAYNELHKRGVLHGDVHPGNVLVDRNRSVRLIDFGLADRNGSGLSRGGRLPFLEPEGAASLLNKGEWLPLTPEAEQFRIAALIWTLYTGRSPVPTTADYHEILQRISEFEPTSWCDPQLDHLPYIRAVLQRAAARIPSLRYQNLDEFDTALSNAVRADRLMVKSLPLDRITRFKGDLPAAEMTQSAGSVAYGHAGVAYALYRLAGLADRPEDLAAADRWLDAIEVEASDSWHGPPDAPIPDSARRSGLYEGRLGYWVVRAMVSNAQGDHEGTRQTIDRFLADGSSVELIELQRGLAGVLLGTTLLDEAGLDDDRLIPFGEVISERLRADLNLRQSIGNDDLKHLGMAHGWAGTLYALLRWSEARGRNFFEPEKRRLRELAILSEPAEGSARVWPYRADDTRRMVVPWWCNGTAGYVFLWELAFRLSGDRSYFEMAIAAGRHAAIIDKEEAPVDLCCGLAGRGFALLTLHRHNPAGGWLEAAHRLIDQAPRSRSPRPLGLIKGALGLDLLKFEIERPELARLPLLESIGCRTKVS